MVKIENITCVKVEVLKSTKQLKIYAEGEASTINPTNVQLIRDDSKKGGGIVSFDFVVDKTTIQNPTLGKTNVEDTIPDEDWINHIEVHSSTNSIKVRKQ